MAQMQKGKQSNHPPIRLVAEIKDADPIERVFTHPFRIGRDNDCDIVIKNSHVSRNHIEIDYKDNCWWAHDLESTNGIYVNGQKVNHAPIMDKDILHLGKDGPRLVFNYISADSAASLMADAKMVNPGRFIPETKKMVAFVLAAVVLGGGGLMYGKHQLGRQDDIAVKAEMLFSEIRTTDIAIANVFAERGTADKLLTTQRILSLEQERNEAADDYKGYLIQLGMYQSLDQQESQIYNAARFFNESEISMPPAFVSEVKQTIEQYWLGEGEGLLKEGLTRADLFDYTSHVVKSLEDYGLPSEFFYLPLSLSGFEAEKRVDHPNGEVTAGIWQLSAASGAAYGLKTMPQDEEEGISRADERINFEKSTRAAIELLHDIYRNEALASGLLTLAIFLEHERNVEKDSEVRIGTVLQDVPRDITERTLWHIYQNYPGLISKQVYDQVVRIFAAAVIGQDPRLFKLEILTPNASNMFKAF